MNTTRRTLVSLLAASAVTILAGSAPGVAAAADHAFAGVSTQAAYADAAQGRDGFIKAANKVCAQVTAALGDNWVESPTTVKEFKHDAKRAKHLVRGLTPLGRPPGDTTLYNAYLRGIREVKKLATRAARGDEAAGDQIYDVLDAATDAGREYGLGEDCNS